MNVRCVDPRDIGVEIQPLSYRVYFWEAKTFSHDGIDGTSWAADEYEMTETSDVAEVIEWANQNARGRTYALYVVFRLRPEEQELTAIQLFGVDPAVPR